jgi:hypothetical protein
MGSFGRAWEFGGIQEGEVRMMDTWILIGISTCSLNNIVPLTNQETRDFFPFS